MRCCSRSGLAIILLSLMLNCTGKTFYYRPQGNQYQFNLDSKACLEQAEMMSRTHMVNQEAGRPDPILLQKYYVGCVYGRGWSKIPLNQRNRSLWSRKGNNLYFKTFSLSLPKGFSLLKEGKWVIGPSWVHQLQALGPRKKNHLVLVAQESRSDPFETINYPVPEGYAYYTGGRLDKQDVRWSIFVGKDQQNPVALLGAYIYLEKTRRVSVVFSRVLTSTGPPTPGYSLSLNQKKELDQIYPQWLSWLKSQTGGEEFVEKPRVRDVFHFSW